MRISYWSSDVCSSDLWKRLPDSRLDLTARIAAAECYGVVEPDPIVPAPGTQALIQALPRLRPATSVAVVAPTSTEPAHCWRAAGQRVGEDAGIRSEERRGGNGGGRRGASRGAA